MTGKRRRVAHIMSSIVHRHDTRKADSINDDNAEQGRARELDGNIGQAQTPAATNGRIRASCLHFLSRIAKWDGPRASRP